MTTPTWVDPQGAHNPTTSNSIPASWGDQVRDDLVFTRTAPGAKVVRVTTQSGIANSTFTPISFGSSVRDTDAMWSGGSATRVTSKFSGWYQCNANGYFTASGGTLWVMALRVNGATYQVQGGFAGSLGPSMCIGDLIYLAANDYVELMVFQNSGASMTFQVAALSVTWAGA